MKIISILSFALIMLLATVTVTLAQERHGGGGGMGGRGEWHGGGGEHWHGGGGWNHGGWGGSYGGGDNAFLGGIIGGAAINWLFPPAPPQVVVVPAPEVPEVSIYQQRLAYCSAKYRTYDPESGTYMGYDGLRHVCQ